MFERVIWMRTDDGLTHRALITSGGCTGYTIRSDCGLISHAYRQEEIKPEVEVTCPVCRCKTVANVLPRRKAA